jgi:hypothetical protein
VCSPQGCQNSTMRSLSLFFFAALATPAGAESSQEKTPSEPESTYTEVVQQALTDAVPFWFKSEMPKIKRLGKEGGVVALELQIAADGSTVNLRLVVGSGSNLSDDMIRRLVLTAEPFPAPPPVFLAERRTVACLTRFEFTGKGAKAAVSIAATCENSDATLTPVVGLSDDFAGQDASGLYLLGLRDEAKSNVDAAMDKYRRAMAAAPALDWAPRALGLALVAKKKAADAIPFLRLYVNAHAGSVDVANYAREIARFDKIKAAREAEANRVRDRLSKEDLEGGVRKGYPLLEPCLKVAREQHALAQGVDTLVFTFGIQKDGTTVGARLEGPGTLLMSEHAECLERALSSWQFPRYSAGSQITVSHLPIKVRGSSAAEAVASAATVGTGAAADASREKHSGEALANEPFVSQCQRSPEEMQSYMKSRYGKIQACILNERRRAPAQQLPDSLPILFVVDVDGPVRNVTIGHRFFREGPLAQCIAEALKGSLDSAEGADCPAEFSIDLRALQPPQPPGHFH